MDEGVDRSACVEVVVFTTLQDTQLELAIELVDDRLPSISQFNNLIGHAAETAHYIHTSTHCADLSILHSQDKYKSLAYVSIFGDSNCWVVRTWEDLELVINPYKVGPAEMLTWRVWPYFSACARHNSVRRNILGHFLLISIALEHRHRPIFPLNMGLFSLWHHCNDTPRRTAKMFLSLAPSKTSRWRWKTPWWLFLPLWLGGSVLCDKIRPGYAGYAIYCLYICIIDQVHI